MQKQLLAINAQIERLSRKQARNEAVSKCLLKRQKKITSLLESPIRMILGNIINEVLSVIIFEYLGIDYCSQHDTHFPTVFNDCVACMVISHDNMTVICNLKAVKIKVCGETTKIIDFHSDDADVKYHIMKILPPLDYYQILSNVSTQHLTSNHLLLCLMNDRKFAIIKQKSKPRDKIFGHSGILCFELTN